MEFQGERVPGVDMDLEIVESMAQDEIPEQEMLVEQDELPQPNPEPEMGAAVAAVYDTFPPLLRNPPPTLAELAQPGELDMILQAISGMKSEMNGMTQTLREEMQQMGRGLQAGIKAIVCSETRTAGEKMAPLRAGTNELRGVQRLSGPQGRRERIK